MKINSLLFLLLCTLSLHAQHSGALCAFDDVNRQQFITAAEARIRSGVAAGTEKSDHYKIIPVVVHVFHTGGIENISDAQIQSQIDVLNEDYGKMAGTNGDGNGVDTEVRFQLAKIDPNGNCTNGIVRIYSTLTNHKTYERPLLKELSFWDNERYLNMYIVKSIPGSTAGYSSFPGGPADEDGLVVRNNYFGRIGTAAGSLGRTATHEVGHWLGLYHTFNNGCGTDVCTTGDYVCDTPPVATANFGCSANNSCSNDSPNLSDLIANYMDYADDNCKNMFTAGQAERIQATLETIREVIWSESNLIAAGCDTDYVAPPSCPVVANFASLNSDVCLNNSVSFVDASLNGVTSWTWYFPGGTPSTSTLQSPVVAYPALGLYDVALVVSDGITSDSINKPNFVTVSNPGVGISLPYQENFESGVFPPSGITINNPDGEVSWELDSAAYVSSLHSIRINNLINTNYGTIDDIILPFLNLASVSGTPYMKYSWAYAKSDALYSDEMIVRLSTDCGVTWTQIFYKTGSQLASGPTQTTPFIPTPAQWKNANINLSAYSSEEYVLIKITNVTDGGNNLYIDDINIDGQASIDEREEDLFRIYPNPSNGELNIDLIQVKEPSQLKVIGIDGRIVFEKSLEPIPQKIRLTNMTTGIYIIQLITDSGIQTKQIVIE